MLMGRSVSVAWLSVTSLSTQTGQLLSGDCHSALAQCARGGSLSEAYPKICSDFHDLRMLYRIALSSLVTTARVERGFSKLALLETKLRSTMTEELLEALMPAVVERDLLLQLSTDDLVAQFAAAAADRRMNLG